MRLIDADAMLKELGVSDRDIYCKCLIEEQPTVEAIPVVHGEWVLDKRKDRIYCNHCNNYTPYEWSETVHEVSELISNFCPNCGADMREKE